MAFTRLTRFAVLDGGGGGGGAASTEQPASPHGSGGAATAAPSPPSSAPAVARDHLRLPAAVVRGALSALGLEATVSAEAPLPPAVDFTVSIPTLKMSAGGAAGAPQVAPGGDGGIGAATAGGAGTGGGA